MKNVCFYGFYLYDFDQKYFFLHRISNDLNLIVVLIGRKKETESYN